MLRNNRKPSSLSIHWLYTNLKARLKANKIFGCSKNRSKQTAAQKAQKKIFSVNYKKRVQQNSKVSNKHKKNAVKQVKYMI